MTFISQPDGSTNTPDILSDETGFYETAGKQIRRQRRLRNLTQSHVAAGLGMRFQQVQKYECGANKVSLYNYLRICIELSCNPGNMFCFLKIAEYIGDVSPAIVDVNTFYDRLGTDLRRKRREADLTQTEVGEAIGVRFQQIQKYESGANKIGMRNFFNMAAVCGVSTTEALKMAITALHNSQRDMILIGNPPPRRYDRRS